MWRRVVEGREGDRHPSVFLLLPSLSDELDEVAVHGAGARDEQRDEVGIDRLRGASSALSEQRGQRRPQQQSNKEKTKEKTTESDACS